MSKVKFLPTLDGFRFRNGFILSKGELDQVHEIVKKAADAVVAALTPNLTWVDLLVAPLGIPPGTLEAGSAIAISAGAVDGLIDDHFIKSTGFCGGMAWTACDYWMLGWPIMRGDDTVKAANITDPRARVLRDYLWNRHLDTYRSGVVVDTLRWMAILKLIPEGAGGGAPALKKMTACEIEKLKSVIDQERTCPIALIRDTWDPSHNHQVLAYGYEGSTSGRFTVWVYDNVSPDEEIALTFDFGAPAFGDNLRGFFVPNYSIKRPPLALGLADSLAINAVPPYALGESVTFSYAIENLGCGTSVPVRPAVHGHQAVAWLLDTPKVIPTTSPPRVPRKLDDGPTPHDPAPMHQLAEKNFYAESNVPNVTLAPGAITSATVTCKLGAGSWDITAAVDIGQIDGKPVYKLVPTGPSPVNDQLRVGVPEPKPRPTTSTSSTSSTHSNPPPTPPSPPHPVHVILRPR